jgi:diadenosine tetraphosphate (Ap4A) HIT family hydrolase
MWNWSKTSVCEQDCPFCRISPERIVGETPLTLTIRDAFPASPGRTLIIPKRHLADLFGATGDEIAEIWAALRQAADRLNEERHPDGYNEGIDVGQAAGQTVMHLHVHLIPRYAGDRHRRRHIARPPQARMSRVADLSDAEIQRLILDMPFRKFAQRGFVDYGRDVSRVRFAPALWKRLTDEDRRRLRETSKQAIERYCTTVQPETS